MKQCVERLYKLARAAIVTTLKPKELHGEEPNMKEMVSMAAKEAGVKLTSKGIDRNGLLGIYENLDHAIKEHLKTGKGRKAKDQIKAWGKELRRRLSIELIQRKSKALDKSI